MQEESNETAKPRRNWGRVLVRIVGVLVVIGLIIQLVPLSRDNPAVASEPAWDSPETRALAQNACFDCHSNETVWPWYSKVSPSKLLVWVDVTEGRSAMNFSDWQARSRPLSDIVEVIDSGSMPPFYYPLMHSEAKLSDTQKAQLIEGLRATLSQTDTGQTG